MTTPRAYVEGEVEFYDCQISVTPDVLIPRQETEILVDLVLKKLGKGTLLDLCSGSGCIGLSIKKHLPDLDVVLSDISQKAIDLARKNAEKNNLDVSFFVGDLFNSLTEKKFDYLVCNPPYISEEEYIKLEPSVKDYEPKQALVGGDDGLLFYRRLETEMPNFLSGGAKVFFEIGYTQGKALLEIFSNPIWNNQEVLKDWAGHDRFFFLEFDPKRNYSVLNYK